MNKALKWAIAMVIALALGALCTYIPLKRHFKAQIEALKPEEVIVIKRDTITAYFPVEIEKRVLVHDSIAVPVMRTDTLFRTDTLYLPREQKVYADSSYRAVVSGISPRLDTIEVYNKTIIQTKIATLKEWRKFDYGIQAGVGLVLPYGEKPSLGGYAGFGITYHF